MTDGNRSKPPSLTCEDATHLARERYGIGAQAKPLPSYIDQNFLLEDSDGGQWVLKVANSDDRRETLEFENAAMARLAEREPGLAPVVRGSLAGNEIEHTTASDGRSHFVRAVSYLPGQLLSEVHGRATSDTWRSLGNVLGRIDRALDGLEQPAMDRWLRWDLAHADWIVGKSRNIDDPGRRALVERAQLQFLADVKRVLPRLPRSVIYNDANDNNLVVTEDGGAPRIASVFDFGDLVRSARVFELAVGCTYAALGQKKPTHVIGEVVRGYHEIQPLDQLEIATLFPSICMRLAVSVTISAQDAELDPDNDHIRVSEAPAWNLLQRLMDLDPGDVEDQLERICGRTPKQVATSSIDDLRQSRRRLLGPSLSLSYQRPLEIVRGRMQYLFDSQGRAYLDCVNNVCHVGHCHPRVVQAAQEQISTLNTNSRYLHENILRYAERLTSLLPDPLRVCYFVNSGTEANELALRLARASTGRQAMVAVEAGYHGHSSSLIDLSSYKHAGPGGEGPPDWVRCVPCPDIYRGIYRDDAEAAQKYADHVAKAFGELADCNNPGAGFLCEPLIGCGGQIVPPQGYLQQAFDGARAAGAVCIADEVQVGFGRVGTHMWAFEQQGAVPDILTLGKPMGNGHPLAAVVTTREIAEAFDNGMEFFSTFGGNPVSCAIGLAVLDVIENENLMENARAVGERLLTGFQELAETHPAIGDVRGCGLYLGVELVKDWNSRDLQPDAELLAAAIERSRDSGVLLSSDGPDHNVLKIKPPMTFTAQDADLLLAVFDRCLSESEGSS